MEVVLEAGASASAERVAASRGSEAGQRQRPVRSTHELAQMVRQRDLPPTPSHAPSASFESSLPALNWTSLSLISSGEAKILVRALELRERRVVVAV